jgi:hypothetical protein
MMIGGTDIRLMVLEAWGGEGLDVTTISMQIREGGLSVTATS